MINRKKLLLLSGKNEESAWGDISKATLDATIVLSTINPSFTLARSLQMSEDGLTAHFAVDTPDAIYELSLDTPFDFRGTVTSVGSTLLPSPRQCRLNSDGTKLYFGGNSTITQRTLNTPWKPIDGFSSSVSYDTTPFVNPYGVFTNPDDFRFYGFHQGVSDGIVEYIMSTKNDISTTSAGDQWFSVEDSASKGVILNPTGTKGYYFGDSSDTLYSFSMNPPYDITSCTNLPKQKLVTGNLGSISSLEITANKIYLFTSTTLYQYSY